jgi:hypothetical protein
VPGLDFGHVIEKKIKVEKIRVVKIIFSNLNRVSATNNAPVILKKQNSFSVLTSSEKNIQEH